jgi:hypothetical protein
MVKGAMADRLFAQTIAGFPIGDDVVSDALRGAAVAGDESLADHWNALDTSDQDEVRSALTEIGTELAARWPSLPSAALPRLQSTLRVELCGGQVILTGRVDLTLGQVLRGRSSTVLLDVKTGTPRIDDRADADWYALLETLRAGCQPFQSGNYYVSTGFLDIRPVTLEDMQRTTSRVADALNRLGRLASGAAPNRSPGPLCPWCPAYATCEEGQQHIRGSESATNQWLQDFDDEWHEESTADDI